MFCDMVGSTAIGVRLDPEDLHDVVAAYHRCVTEHVARYGGFIARYMGDGVLAYFGYPVANEDDAERAVRAGLAVAEAVASLNTVAGPPSTLRARIGIATGLVIVGHLIGTGAITRARQWSATRRTLRRTCRPSPNQERLSSTTARSA